MDDIVEVSDREYEVRGRTNLDDLMEEIPLGFESDDYDTIGGYITGEFDHFPKLGETYVTPEGVIITVAATKKRRIELLRIRLPKDFNEVSKESAHDKDQENSDSD